MQDKFRNKYRISSARLKNWDYGSNAAYFLTINAYHHQHYFGYIEEEEMYFNEVGKLADKYWLEIPKHFPFIELGEYQVMPNHVHGILILEKKYDVLESVETLQCNVSTDNVSTGNEGTADVGTANDGTANDEFTNDTPPKNQFMSDISPKSGTISTILRSYKSVVTKHAHYIQPDFSWQERFHDHIIRDSRAFENIQNYIANNVKNWKKDKFYRE